MRVINLRRMKWAGYVAYMGKMRGAYGVLVRGPEGKGPLGTPRHRWEDNKIYLQKVGWEDMDWIDLAKNWNWNWVLVNAVTNHWVP